MVYIDVRDRKFLLLFVFPVVLGVIFAVLVLSDQPDVIDFVGVGLVVWAVLWFVVYLAVNFVLERVQSSSE